MADEADAVFEKALKVYLDQGGIVSEALAAVALGCEHLAASVAKDARYVEAAKYQAAGEQIASLAKRIKV